MSKSLQSNGTIDKQQCNVRQPAELKQQEYGKTVHDFDAGFEKPHEQWNANDEEVERDVGKAYDEEIDCLYVLRKQALKFDALQEKITGKMIFIVPEVLLPNPLMLEKSLLARLPRCDGNHWSAV
ncbi:hypothetical protein MHU86_11360 [Fragilaria crotonensis]|nr:hypothetical protein MHU86_11360 [Fragilaria crotonensis]